MTPPGTTTAPDRILEIRRTRCTRSGGLLLELPPDTPYMVLQQWRGWPQKQVDTSATISLYQPRLMLQIRDLAATLHPADVLQAYAGSAQYLQEDIHIMRMLRSSTDIQHAILGLPVSVASHLFAQSHIHVGPSRCRVQLECEDRRCFRCRVWPSCLGLCKTRPLPSLPTLRTVRPQVADLLLLYQPQDSFPVLRTSQYVLVINRHYLVFSHLVLHVACIQHTPHTAYWILLSCICIVIRLLC